MLGESDNHFSPTSAAPGAGGCTKANPISYYENGG
jgi:hypothetical protein